MRSVPPAVAGGLAIIDGQSYEVGPDTGIYIRPNQTFAINNPGARSITIISSQCPDPDRAPRFINEPATHLTQIINPSPIVRLADQSAQPTADRWYRVLVDDASAAPRSLNLSVRFLPAARRIISSLRRSAFHSERRRPHVGRRNEHADRAPAHAFICRKARCIASRIPAKVSCVCWECFIRRAVRVSGMTPRQDAQD